MQKTASLYTSRQLDNISLAYSNENYVAERFFPIVTVKKDTGKITTYAMDNLRIVKALRSIGSKTNEVGHSVSIGDHYVLKEYALMELVPDEHMEQAEAPIHPKIDATENITERLLVIKESAMATAVSATATMTSNTTLSGTDQWSDYTNSDPIGDVKTGKEAVRTASGKKANTLLLSHNAYIELLDHPDIIDRLKYVKVADKDAAKAALARIFDLDEVIVGDAQYNNSAEGGTDTLAEIWDKVAIIAYIEKRPTLKSRTLGFTYQMKAPRYVDGWRDEDRRGDYIRVTDKFDQQLIDVNCGYLIKDCVA